MKLAFFIVSNLVNGYMGELSSAEVDDPFRSTYFINVLKYAQLIFSTQLLIFLPCAQIQLIINRSQSLSMQLTAKLIQLLPLQTGAGKNGEWKKQDIIVETTGQYPKKVCVSIWGDKIDSNKLKPGNILKMDFEIESREYNSRWYTDVRAWRIEVQGGQGSTPENDYVPPTVDMSAQSDDDMPF